LLPVSQRSSYGGLYASALLLPAQKPILINPFNSDSATCQSTPMYKQHENTSSHDYSCFEEARRAFLELEAWLCSLPCSSVPQWFSAMAHPVPSANFLENELLH
jgi:hypothetical protein